MDRPDGRLMLAPTDVELVEAIAQRVAELLREDTPTPGALVDAQTLAGLLGVSRAHVYRNANKLGAQRIGDGERPRLRFDPAVALQARERTSSPRPPPVQPRRRRQLRSSVPLLPIRP
jgi:hypothetical protein